MNGDYQEKEILLLQALIERKGLQNIADTAAQVFGNPVFISDLGYKILCCSQHTSAFDSFWEYLQSSSYSLPEQIAQIMRSGDFSKIYTSDQPLVGQYSFAPSPFLAARIRGQSQPLGHVCVYGCQKPFQEVDKKLIVLLAKVLSYEMVYRGLSASLQIPYYSFLTDLLEGRLTDSKELEARKKYLKITLPASSRLVLIRFQTPMVQTVVSYLREYLLQKLPHCLGIVYKEELLLLMPESSFQKNSIEKILSSYQENIDYRIGVSNSITRLQDLNVYYQQAAAAIKIGNLLKSENRFCMYQDFILYQLLFLAKKELDLTFLCHPALLEMQEYDRKNHTEYIQDLELYLKCGKNINKAAKEACVHKNSMYYRISRLEEKFSISLADEDTCFYLQISLKILQLLNQEI